MDNGMHMCQLEKSQRTSVGTTIIKLWFIIISTHYQRDLTTSSMQMSQVYTYYNNTLLNVTDLAACKEENVLTRGFEIFIFLCFIPIVIPISLATSDKLCQKKKRQFHQRKWWAIMDRWKKCFCGFS